MVKLLRRGVVSTLPNPQAGGCSIQGISVVAHADDQTSLFTDELEIAAELGLLLRNPKLDPADRGISRYLTWTFHITRK
jgi:hypothetical protein